MRMKSIISFILIILQAAATLINGGYLEDRHECRGGDFKNINVKNNRDSAFNKLLALHKSSSYNGFQHTQAGDKPEEQVSASYLCPPDVQSKPICECCLTELIEYVKKKCPKQNEVVAWDTYPFITCMLRYSVGRKFLSVLDDWAWYCDEDLFKVRTVELEKAMDGLVSRLKEQAAGGNGVRKFASGRVSYDRDEFAIFAAAQCTPDLSKGDCVKCLTKASNGIRSCSTRKAKFAGSYLSGNCYVWYSHTYGILDPPTKFNHTYCSL